MTRPFVMVPISLIRCPDLSDTAIRLWALVRGRNGEKEFKGCFESAARMSQALRPRQRTRCRVLTSEVPTCFKRAQQQLLSHGLLVVKRRGTGKTALRWALVPHAHGDIELRELFRRGDIGDQDFQSIQARRAVSNLLGGLVATGLAGSQKPTIQNQKQNQ